MQKTIHPEKRKAIMDELAQMRNPTCKTLRSLAARHGVGFSTITNWRRQEKAKTARIFTPASAVAPPVAVPVSDHRTFDMKSAYLRQLAAQALFIAEQLEVIAQE